MALGILAAEYERLVTRPQQTRLAELRRLAGDEHGADKLSTHRSQRRRDYRRTIVRASRYYRS